MRSGFYEDTDILAEDFAKAFGGIITSGVLIAADETALQVTAASGMSVTVATGRCWIEGHYGAAESEETLSLSLSDGTYDRIDRVIVRNDMGSGKMSVMVLEGTASSAPTAPDIVRDGTYYDICLAEITVASGTIELTDDMITDRRTNDELCGICQSTVQDIDIEALFARYEGIMQDMVRSNQKKFSEWFATLQNELDANQAANLQKQIDGLKIVDTTTGYTYRWLINDGVLSLVTTDDEEETE